MKTRYIAAILVISLIGIGIAAANPQILQYYSGYWFNDRMEEVNPAIIQEYYTVSNSPWVIYVTAPELHYQGEFTYSNGEVISIQKGTDTINITADVTTTLTIH